MAPRDDIADVRESLGEMRGEMKSMSESVANMRMDNRTDFAILFAKIEDLQKNGCAAGRKHTDDITELKERPTKALNIATGLVALGSAAVSALTGWAVFNTKGP